MNFQESQESKRGLLYVELKRVESVREVAEEKIRGKRKSCMGSVERGRGRVVNRAVRSGIVSS